MRLPKVERTQAGQALECGQVSIGQTRAVEIEGFELGQPGEGPKAGARDGGTIQLEPSQVFHGRHRTQTRVGDPGFAKIEPVKCGSDRCKGRELSIAERR